MSRDRMVWKWDTKMLENEELEDMQRVISRGAALAHWRHTVAMSSFLPDINVQFPGAEIIDSRQYRHTCVSGMIEIASLSRSLVMYRAI